MGAMEEYQAYNSREHDAIIGSLNAELVQEQQALTQSKDEMIIMDEHQKVFEQLKVMLAT
jgi:hypothetical protein